MTTNFEPTPKVEETTEENVAEAPAEVVEEVKAEVEPVVKPEPVKATEAPKKPEPYVRPPVALPKEEAGRRPRNVPRYR
jgi:hypothetical protein